MISPIVVGMLGGALAARFMLRRRFAAAGRCAGARHGRWGRARFVDTGRVAADRLARVVAVLELNDRQKEEVHAALATVRDKVGVPAAQWPLFGQALAQVAAERFDAGALAGQPPEVVDAFEHIHNILTPEQRQALTDVL
jgi:hypothetical protein